MPLIVIPPPLDFLSLVRGRAMVCFLDFDWLVASTVAWTKSSMSSSRAVFERRSTQNHVRVLAWGHKVPLCK